MIESLKLFFEKAHKCLKKANSVKIKRFKLFQEQENIKSKSPPPPQSEQQQPDGGGCGGGGAEPGWRVLAPLYPACSPPSSGGPHGHPGT